MNPGSLPCDVWLWDGSSEYEGVVMAFDCGRFAAHIRQKSSASHATGRRLNTSFIDLQTFFVETHFYALCPRYAGTELQNSEITAAQRSGAPGFDFFVSGILRALDDEQRALLKSTPARDPSPFFGEARFRPKPPPASAV
jgi:hypothetical protein